MSHPKKSLCEGCGELRRACIMHKGKNLCKLCIRRLPNTRLQDGVIMIYDYLLGRRKGGRPKKPKDLNTPYTMLYGREINKL